MMRNRKKTADILLTAAKVTGVAAITLVTTLFVSQRVASPEGGTVEATYATVSRAVLVVGALLGLVLSWKWPVRGAIIVLGAFVLVYGLDLISVSHLSSDWILPLTAFSALLFLLGGILLKQSEEDATKVSQQ